MNIIEKARLQRKNIIATSNNLDDKSASETPELFNKMRYDGSLIKVGTKINWNGVVKKATVDLWDTEENNPDHASNLWEDISYKDGIRIIPEVITVTTMFSKNEKGWWHDELYISLIDNNVWTPTGYPQGWEKQ